MPGKDLKKTRIRVPSTAGPEGCFVPEKPVKFRWTLNMDDEHESRNTSRHSQLLSQVLDVDDTDMDEESPKVKSGTSHPIPAQTNNSYCSNISRCKRRHETSEENISPKRERLDLQTRLRGLSGRITNCTGKYRLQSSPKSLRGKRARPIMRRCHRLKDIIDGHSSRVSEVEKRCARSPSVKREENGCGGLVSGTPETTTNHDRNVKILFNNAENFMKTPNSDLTVEGRTETGRVNAIKTKSSLEEETQSFPVSRIRRTITKPTSFLNNLMSKIPTYRRGTANLRLNMLREHLIEKQMDKNKVMMAKDSIQKIPEKSIVVKDNDDDNDGESMDWQPLDWMKYETFEASPTTTTTTTVDETAPPDRNNLATKSLNQRNDSKEMFETINKNLLELTNHEQNTPHYKREWLKDHYYFILDTNVLIRHMDFLDELLDMKLCDTKGSILFLPYCVLQELDKLKHYHYDSKSVKTMTLRAIRYVNQKLQNRCKFLQAQNALEEQQAMVNIKSPDDSILNACLQVKQHVPNVILLTEDVNLRNKCAFNNITATAINKLKNNTD